MWTLTVTFKLFELLPFQIWMDDFFLKYVAVLRGYKFLAHGYLICFNFNFSFSPLYDPFLLNFGPFTFIYR
uniref:Uncharacterized protein n=1 Tax=Rhizophora mucronata TaxID=61149 RepID=A0A2P2Q3D9_RHIMU